jgi:hypothetical protein
LPYEESEPFVAVQWTPQFTGDSAAAARAIYAAALPGDYEGNGKAEIDDYQLWRSKFGNAALTYEGADGNGDAMVDAADYVVWRKASGSPGNPTGSSVPEPAVLGSCALSLAVTLIFTRRRRQW